MNKKLSISVLIITVASLICIGVGIVINEPSYNLVDVQGSKKNIGDVLFLQRQKSDLYKSIQSIVSKDGFEVKKYKNNEKFRSEYNQLIISNPDLFNDSSPYGSGIYKSNENIGYVESLSQTYNENGEFVQEFTIHNKNIKTGEINEYHFKLPEKIESDGNIEHAFVVGIKNDKVYILNSLVAHMNYNRKGEVTSIGDSSLNLYTFNLSTQKVKKNNTYKTFEKDDYKAIFNLATGFNRDNKIYTLVEQVNLKDKSKVDYYLVYYDIDTNEFKNIKEPVIKDSTSPLLGGNITIGADIEGDILYLLQHNKGEKENINIELSKIDLKNDKIDYVDRDYKTGNVDDNYDVTDFRVLNNKIYMCINSWKESNEKYSKNQKKKNSIVVLDEKTGQIIYIGEYINDSLAYPINDILTKDEL
ncbi:hypothetical protein UMC2_02681 [[Clostridium] sordellii]|uniref:hypothetical protein n=1 Tax=Paraclostridium sordellii TaxID=1505 RepID=UPI000544441A|nr:hypothetical protein [Paeniclostridium sordellii]CEK33018.1 hypothetical protein UMC2_02681 [[Clostridium] sordellii] [Paeniclostridium sordellii]